MGDVRRELNALGDQRPGGNLWLRGNAYHIDAEAAIGGYAFSQDAYGVTVGADKAFRLGQNSHILAGLFVGTTSISRDFDNKGDGSSDALFGGLYITWLHNTGWYIDATAKMNQYDNDFTARDTDGSVLGAGQYDNNARGGSLEIGRLIQGPKGWWLEVSVQAAYAEIEGARFTTSTDTPVVIFDSEATQYRGALRWGKLFKDNRLSLWMKAALVGTNNDCGEVRFYGSDHQTRADIDGLRMEAGFGLNYALTKRSQLYFDYEYAKADYYSRPWSFNAGYRLLW
jgi:outer membrane autotransporter protein